MDRHLGQVKSRCQILFKTIPLSKVGKNNSSNLTFGFVSIEGDVILSHYDYYFLLNIWMFF